MPGTIRIEDMKLFAKVAEAKSFTRAARALGVPKQTLSRRIAELERALGVQLLHRTTRRLHLSDAGAAYAERCAEIVRLADDANRAASDADEAPRGSLRLTADPLFGEAFVTDLVVDYARRWPETRVEVVLTRRRVDLIEESFDLAFRIGQADDAALSGVDLGAARVRYCASPGYVARRGAPARVEDLRSHDCIVVAAGDAPSHWPFPGPNGPRLVPIAGRLTVTSFAMARAAALADLGVALFPEFACAEDLQNGRLVPVLDGCVVDVGRVWLLYVSRRLLPPRLRAFVDLARERLAPAPWQAREGGAHASGAPSTISHRRRR
jgi:DNA-binding transcriptional LysR family regulator